MGRLGGNSGKGGRNYRLNWSATADGGAVFSGYSIHYNWQGTSFPWSVHFKGEPMLQAHGACTGYRRFKTMENAKRWVERRIAKRRLA
jgi:hypothetical protein